MEQKRGEKSLRGPEKAIETRAQERKGRGEPIIKEGKVRREVGGDERKRRKEEKIRVEDRGG